jgi:hypothetical protein
MQNRPSKGVTGKIARINNLVAEFLWRPEITILVALNETSYLPKRVWNFGADFPAYF